MCLSVLIYGLVCLAPLLLLLHRAGDWLIAAAHTDEFTDLASVGVNNTSENSKLNRSKNRYRNITAYDRTRVVLDILEVCVCMASTVAGT